MRILIARSSGPAGTDLFLAAHRHCVDLATTVSEAKLLIDERSPDLVMTGLLFDRHFPSPTGDDGLAVLQAALVRGIRCISLTSWASVELQRCAMAGFSHVFLMPFNPELLLDAVEAIRKDLALRSRDAHHNHSAKRKINLAGWSGRGGTQLRGYRRELNSTKVFRKHQELQSPPPKLWGSGLG